MALGRPLDLVIAKPAVGLSFSAALAHYADRDEPYHHFPQRRSFTSDEYLADSLLGGRTPVSPSCSLVRRGLAHFRLPIGESPELNQIAERFGAGPDLLFLLEAAAGSGEVAHVPKFLSHFGAGQTSITVNNPADVKEGYRLTREFFVGQIADRPGLAHVKRRFNVRRWRKSLKRALKF